MRTAKAFALLLALALLLCGCDTTNTSSTNSQFTESSAIALPDSMRVLYSSKDTLNPYNCSTLQNRIVCQLLFDPLYKLDTAYNPVACLANGAKVQGNTCTVTLKNAKFSNGSAVTPADVVFSFEKAKSSATKYAAALSTVSKAAAEENGVRFTLTRSDPYCLNLLTFPIIKSGSDDLKNNDNKSLPPIGCGRYIFNESSAELTASPGYYGEAPKVSKIQTVDCPDDESVLEAVESQMVDLYYTELSSSNIPKMNGTAKNVPQNHLVFLGVNPAGALQNVYLRQAVSAALGREKLCREAYYSKAQPAVGLFPENWAPVQNRQTIEKQQNLEIAAQNLTLAGYTEKNSSGLYLTRQKKPLTLTLIVNSENAYRTAAAKLLVTQLKAAGITLQLRAENYSQYTADIAAGRYDLYLSEVRLEDNMDPGCLAELYSGNLLSGKAVPSSSAASSAAQSSSGSGSSQNQSSQSAAGSNSAAQSSAGTTASSATSSAQASSAPVQEITLTTANACKGFYSGSLQITDIVTAFTAELPVIPVLFKSGLAIYNNGFEGLTPTVTDLFYGI